MSKSKSVVAKDVRAYFQADEKRRAGLSDAALHTLRKGARGRVHPEARERYGKRTGNDYTEGNAEVYDIEGVQFTPVEARQALVQAGVTDFGKRGPLTQANIAKAASLIGGAAPVNK